MPNSPDGRDIAAVGVATHYVTQTVVVAATTDYTAGDVLSDSASSGTYLKFSDVVPEKGGSGQIKGAICISQSTQIAFRPTLLLYHTIPTSNMNDNAADTAGWTDRAKAVGDISFSSFSTTTGGAKSEVSEGEGGIPKNFKCAHDDNALYGILKTEDTETSEVAGHSYIVVLLIQYN